MYYKQLVMTPLGELLLLSDANALCGAWFTDQKYFGAGYDLQTASFRENEILKQAKAWLKAYFAQQALPKLELSLPEQLTPYRRKVLQVLAKVPLGEVISYQELAQKYEQTYKQKTASRAIGQAIAHNPLVLFIPCHRIIASDKTLGGYAAGLERKQALLELERK